MSKLALLFLLTAGLCAQTTIKDTSPRTLAGGNFSQLGAQPDGTVLYCRDCTPGTPTSSGGTGVFVRKENGIWNGGYTSAGVFNVVTYGAKGDGRTATDGAISSGTTAFTSASASFVAGDVGKSIIVRGAGASGAPLYTTISARVSGTAVTLAASADTTVSGGSYWYASDDNAAFAATITAAKGGVVTVPPGNYWLGRGTGKCIQMNFPTGSIVGSGRGITNFWYGSIDNNVAGTCDGTLIAPGFATAGALGPYIFQGFTVRDLNTGNATSGSTGNAGAAISAYSCTFVVEDSEFLDIKGNSAVDFNGDGCRAAAKSPDPLIQNSYFTGTSAGGWIEGDGINMHSRDMVQGNRITGTLRHAVEGGNAMPGVYYLNNIIDMQSQGFNCFATAAINGGTVSGNTCTNIANGRAGLAIENDDSTFPVGNCTVTNNDFRGPGAVLVALQPHTGTTITGPVLITNNRLTGMQPLQVQNIPIPTIQISGNTFDTMTAEGPILFGYTNSVASGAQLIITGNVWANPHSFDGSHLNRWINLSITPSWGPILRASGNTVGTGNFDCFNSQVDGCAYDGIDIPSIAAGGASASRTVTMTGAIVGKDMLTGWSADATPLPNGVLVEAYVSANDTITWRLINTTNAAVDPPNHNYLFAASRLQPGGHGGASAGGGSGALIMASAICDATTAGRFNYLAGGAGAKDVVRVCAKDASNVYAWRPIF